MSNEKIKMYIKQTRRAVVELDPKFYPEDERTPEAIMTIEKENAKTHPEYFDNLEGEEEINISIGSDFFKDKVDWKEFAAQYSLDPDMFITEIFKSAAALGTSEMDAQGKNFMGLKFDTGAEDGSQIWVMVERRFPQEAVSELKKAS